MLIKTLVVGHLGTNCYVVTDEESLQCAVIDPGDESGTIMDYLEDNKLQCKAIFLTHGHFDHTGAVRALIEETGAELFMHQADCGPEHHQYDAPDGVKFYGEGDKIEVGALQFKIIATPGHTLGGVTIICEDALFTGDTLFRDSCGRTDLPGGDMRVEMQSLRRLVMLDGEYDVYPGHMEATTLLRERNYNPYVLQAIHM